MSKAIDDLLGVAQSQAGQIHSDLSGVTIAQGFQGLTRQTFAHVITWVQEVEDNRVELLRRSGRARFERAGESGESARAVHMMRNVPAGGGAVSDRDEVDDLLSSLARISHRGAR